MWTRFMDMHSGGSAKERWSYIYIEAPEDEARLIFYNRFGHNPERVTCTCCGNDYSISSDGSLKQLTGYDRGCANLKTPRVNGRFNRPADPWFDEHYYLDPDEHKEASERGYEIEESWRTRKWMSLEEYVKSDGVLVIRAKSIKDSERKGSLPVQGYVWMD